MAAPHQDVLQQVAYIEDVGRIVRARRIMMGMRQEDLARLAGISRSRLLALEHNNSVDGLSFRKLNALLSALGLQLAISLKQEPQPARADVAAHKRNALRVPPGVVIKHSSMV